MRKIRQLRLLRDRPIATLSVIIEKRALYLIAILQSSMDYHVFAEKTHGVLFPSEWSLVHVAHLGGLEVYLDELVSRRLKLDSAEDV